MVTLEKSGDSAVKFVFTDSDHYLYGDGEVVVPINSLSLVIDESDMVTFKKAATADPFISFRADNSNLGTKAAIEQFYKDNMVGSTGGGSESGITPSEVQEMIDNSLEDYYTDDEVDAALSGKASASDVTALENEVATKADTSAVTAVANDVQTVSGQVQAKVAITDFNTYSAATDSRLAEDEEVTAAALNDLQENKADTSAVTQEISAAISGKADTSAVTTVNDALTGHTADTTVHVTSADKTAWNNKSDFSGDYNDLTNKPTIPTVPTNISDFTNDAGYITSADITAKADASAVTAVNNVLTAHTADTTIHVTTAQTEAWNAKANIDHVTQSEYDAMVTAGTLDSNTMYIIDDAVPFDPSTKVDVSAITSSITSSSTDSEIPTAKATYDAIQAGGGGGATYSAGTNISIDTANTINCTLPITADSATSSTFIAGNPSKVVNENILIGSTSLFRTNYKNNVVIGNVGTKASNDCVVIGRNATGGTNNNYDWYNVAIGSLANANGGNHVALGYGVSATGTTKMNLNNQIKVDTNNQVYIKDKTNTTDVCIQDAIAALGGLKLVKLTQNEYDQLATKDPDTLYIISNVVS